MADRRLKIGIAHPRLLRGGSEARAMWGIEALKGDNDVSLITAGDFDLDGLNQFYGTSVCPEDITVRRARMPWPLQSIRGGDALWGCLYQRFCRKVAPEFDVLISAYNPCDFGVPAIHCIADFAWNEEIRKRLHPPPAGGARLLFHKHKLLRRAYLGVARSLRRPSGRDIFAGDDLILANSRWSADILRDEYGIEVDVLYPPVFARFPVVEWEDKEFGFVCIGRISPEKRIERIIEILRSVRERGHDVHLHVIGGTGGKAYGEQVEAACRAEPDWVVLEGRRFGERKARLLAGHKFGIHGCQGEAFGIAVAEMVRAGCIIFVPGEGGQAEIVNHPSLTYDSIEDAIEKIDAVLSRPDRQDELRNHLEHRSEQFSVQHFMDGLRGAVEGFVQHAPAIRSGS